jgi:hypothetical protein
LLVNLIWISSSQTSFEFSQIRIVYVKRSAKEHQGTPAVPTTTVRRQPKAVNGQATKAKTMKTKIPIRERSTGGSQTFDGIQRP